MIAEILTMIALTPVIEIVPEKFDTLHEEAFILYSGIQSPTQLMDIGFELGGKVELLLAHPYSIRFGIDYSRANTIEPFAPEGYRESWTLGLDLVSYRGRDGMMGYLGVGVTYGVNSFKLNRRAADSLFLADGINSVSISDKAGYRIFMGLKFDQRFLAEVSYYYTTPDFVYQSDLGPSSFSQGRDDGALSVGRISLGYIIPF
ncbi:MAG: hypothetical protein IIB00_03930 [candidate division Zixibacteria bacterium]|nr:hypothetical protein [candidate division Zixibacteria bacterium]